MTEAMQIGAMVFHKDDAKKREQRFAEVVGYCPGHEWRRVKTLDGKRRIWAVENMIELDDELADEVRPEFGYSDGEIEALRRLKAQGYTVAELPDARHKRSGCSNE
jgi:hypothetical protein